MSLSLEKVRQMARGICGECGLHLSSRDYNRGHPGEIDNLIRERGEEILAETRSLQRRHIYD